MGLAAPAAGPRPAGLSVAALDLRGYGATDKTPRGYRQAVTGTDISAVIRSLGYSSAYVIGHDWGGVAAWSTYAYAPEQVDGLAIVAAPHPLRFPWPSMGPGLAWFQLPILPERVIMARDGAYVEWLLRRRTAPGSAFPSTADARHYRQALRLWPSPHCALEYLRMFGRDQLRVSGPGLPAGAAGSRTGACADRARRRRTGCCRPRTMLPPAPYAPTEHRHVEIPGAGHLPHEEAPDAVTAALLDWLPA